MRKIIAVLLMCTLCIPVYALENEQGDIEAQTLQEQEQNAEVQNVAENAVAETVEQPLVQTSTTSGLKAPSSKKQLAVKFIVAMLCVAGCSLFLYLSLSVYNKIREGFFAEDAPVVEGEAPLEAPQDLTEAVKTFVDKTHWNGV